MNARKERTDGRKEGKEGTDGRDKRKEGRKGIPIE